MSEHQQPDVIEFSTGPYAGKRAAVTWSDGKWMRATPLDGDPLASHQFEIAKGGFTVISFRERKRPMSDREWAAQPANLREGCTTHVPGVGDP